MTRRSDGTEPRTDEIVPPAPCGRRRRSNASLGIVLIVALSSAVLSVQLVAAQVVDSVATEASSVIPADTLAPDAMGPRRRNIGISFESDDTRHALDVWFRGQIRFSTPFDGDPDRVGEFDQSPGSDFDIRRARLNVRSRLFSPKVQFSYVQELSGDTPLLDLELDVALGESALLQIGQYKIPYNRERVDASSDQQFVERSIATYAFTLDRQRGVTLRRRWAAGTHWQNRIIAGVYEGTGRSADQSADEPMTMIRWEWDFLGEALPYSQSDLAMRPTPAASLAFGTARVDGPYTRFSTAGGGQLDGFEPGDSTRYSIEQWLQEFAWHYRGFSLQQEYHVKTVVDRDLQRESELSGGYVQAGKIWPVELASRVLPIELALRYARIDWDLTALDRELTELTLALNVFFEGHRNKLTFDISRLDVVEATSAGHDTRLRAQWEVSF